MQIDGKLIAYLEGLSCLALTENEKTRLTGDLGAILGAMARLSELDTDDIPEYRHPYENVNAFREDDVQASFARELILRNAAKESEGMFVAPRTLE